MANPESPRSAIEDDAAEAVEGAGASFPIEGHMPLVNAIATMMGETVTEEEVKAALKGSSVDGPIPDAAALLEAYNRLLDERAGVQTNENE